MSETPPWEQQPKESARAYGAFCAYRDLGPCRSLRAAAEAFYRRKSAAGSRQLQTWSATFRWVERAHAWDRHLDAEARQTQEKTRHEMGQRHAKEAQGLQAKALERMRTLRPEEMSAADVLRYFVEAAKLERLALGEPDTLQRQELTGKGGGPIEVTGDVVDRIDQLAAEFTALEAQMAGHHPGDGPGKPLDPQTPPAAQP
jgi:hypothetical protein